ncbi:MAG TPA: hypothetical protein VF397_01440 [Pyrinomonadaceae bacterium]
MATKRVTKKATKKTARKSAKKGITLIFPPPINLKCIEACIQRFERCISRGVDRATCMKRLQKNLGNCQRGIFPTDE